MLKSFHFYSLSLILSVTLGQPCIFTSSDEHGVNVEGNCTEEAGHGFIPERPNKKTIADKTSERGKPQNRTTLPVVKLGDGASYYYLETSVELNYFEAFQFCSKNKMKLLSIETKKENAFISNYLNNKFPRVNCVWTSGTDLGKEGHYVWLSTGQPLTYTNWESDNATGNCIQMWKGFNIPGSFSWFDTPCEFNCYFICETEPIPLCS